MKLACTAFQRVTRIIVQVLLCVIALEGCGGDGSDTSNTIPDPLWVEISSTTPRTNEAILSGTAWINNDFYASNCVGLGCLFDTQRTNDFPGVTVTCQNLTTGMSGSASSYYGPGTNWLHQWNASVPLTAGSNTILVSAFDPNGKGGSTTVTVTAKPPISVLVTTPNDGAPGVLPNTIISADFSEVIDPYHAYFTVQGQTGPVPGVRTVNGATVTFAPESLLAFNTIYTVTLPSTLLSLTGATLVADYTWTFTTMSTPTFYVVATYPANKDAGVTTNLMNISVTFNHDINPNTVTNSKFVVTSPAGTLPGSLQLYKTNIAFYPYDNLATNTTYTAMLKAGIQDTSGNMLPFDYIWIFTTGD